MCLGMHIKLTFTSGKDQLWPFLVEGGAYEMQIGFNRL